MSKRDEIFEMWSPRLLEGCLIILLREINILRSQLNMPLRTELQFYNEIINHVSTLEPYSWSDPDNVEPIEE